MTEREATPPEAVMLVAESPLHFRRMFDMFLSRNDFDPNKYPLKDADYEKRMVIREAEIRKVSTDAEAIRQSALKTLQKTNDISDTLRRIRG